MKKFISILMIAITFMILCTARDPTTPGEGGGGDPTPPPTPTNPIKFTTYEKYTSAIENVRKSDAAGTVAVAYANKNTPWGCDLGFNNSYATPGFFATVDEAVKFDEYTVKVKMKGEPLEYVYIYNSKHAIPAIEDADRMYKELN